MSIYSPIEIDVSCTTTEARVILDSLSDKIVEALNVFEDARDAGDNEAAFSALENAMELAECRMRFLEQYYTRLRRLLDDSLDWLSGRRKP